MIAYLPIPGGHIKLAERFFDPAFSFAMGWNYWYSWTVSLPAELSAAAVLVNYWNKSINNALWITICLIVVVAINFLGAGKYYYGPRVTFMELTVWSYRCLWRGRVYFRINQGGDHSW